jgi:putative ABC transport system ATP-binding protein
MADKVLEAVELSKSYQVDDRRITVLDNISMAVEKGEFLVIEGKSGSGKSTLLSLLSGLDKPDSGRILLNDRDITGLSEDQLAPFRNRTIGYVFQSFHLIPSLTALENIMFPAELNHDPAATAKAAELLRRVDLHQRDDNFPHQLSGGDEPTGNLDSANGETILQLLLKLRREVATTLVMATHSREISSTADRILRLVDGRIDS